MYQILKTLLKEHPTLLLSCCYFVITTIGIVYSYHFYNEFGVNILNFSDLSDFLLVSILTPRSIGIFIAAIIMVILLSFFDSYSRRKIKIYGIWVSRFLKPKYSEPILHISTILIIGTIYVQALAISNAEMIKSGTFDEYVVRMLGTDNKVTEESFALLGGSTRYTYLYDSNNAETLIIPVDNIMLMFKKANDTNHSDRDVNDQGIPERRIIKSEEAMLDSRNNDTPFNKALKDDADKTGAH